ncbi:MAG TPA: FtsX-like permease family protein, partial [Ilumatobacteraceae bacterium]
GFGSADTTAIETALRREDVGPDVADVSYLAFDPSTYLGRGTAPAVFGFANAVDTTLPVLSGRRARTAGEAVLGSETAATLHLGIGDRLTARSDTFGEVPIEIVGIAVLPSAGAFVAERTGLGTGAFILTDLQPGGLAAFVGLTLADGVDPKAFVAKVGDFSAWDTLGPPIIHASPVRPPKIVNVSDIRSAPLILGGVLVICLALGLSLSIATSVRDRRRDLAILRVLGFNDRDLRSSVRWQAATIIVCGLVVGLPLGAVAGRWAWRHFARQLGVAPTGHVPIAWLCAYVAVTVALALAATIPPARTASRSTVTDVLRAS